MASLLLALFTSVTLLTQLHRVKGTTLLASWIWTTLCVWAIAVTSYLGSSSEASYCAGMLVFCPIMSVLGARRPQNRAWEFITASLWVILALPALEVFFARQGEAFDVRGLRSWFFVVLIFITVSNIALSRFWLSGILFGGAQVILVSDYLPTWFQFHLEFGQVIALAVGAAAVSLACFLPKPDRSQSTGVDRVWLNYRDTFGGLWAVRTCESINAYAKMQQWNIRLTWDGFVSMNGECWGKTEQITENPTVEKLHQLLRNQLRRFVDDQWIEAGLSDQTC